MRIRYESSVTRNCLSMVLFSVLAPIAVYGQQASDENSGTDEPARYEVNAVAEYTRRGESIWVG